MNKNRFDQRRKYYIVLDCETATLPWASTLTDPNQKKNVAIAKPLVYDLGWQIIDRKGRVYEKKSYLISEIFSVPSIFNTAYYASKRPQYIAKLNAGEIILADWRSAVAELEKDLQEATAVGAYNAMFDFKKAIPFTEKYINALYSQNYYAWEQKQNAICQKIANGQTFKSPSNFDGDNFCFRGKKYPLFDLWGMSCEHLINNDEYKQMCIDNSWSTASGKYFPTNAEKVYSYIRKDETFEEAHTALEDAEIESEIFAKIMKPRLSNLTIGITYFPFRALGKVADF